MTPLRKRLLFGLGAMLLTLLVAAVAVSAGGALQASAAPPAASPAAKPAGTPATNPKTATQGCMASDFESKLAANLNVPEATLQDAIKKTALQEVDQAQQDGKISADQATNLKNRINNGDFPCMMAIPGKGPQAAPGAGRNPMMMMGQLVDAAAKYLGLTRDQFTQQLQQKGSLQAVLTAQNNPSLTKDGLENALVAALQQDLTSKGVSQDQATTIVNQFKQNFDQIYTSQLGGRGFPFGPTGPRGGNHGPRGPWTGPTTPATPST